MNEKNNQKALPFEAFKTANIIIAGITGAGKSTLINAVFGKEFAKTGQGLPVTSEITEYKQQGVPVRIWDSIGFEIGNDNNGISKTKASITKIKKTIEEQAEKDDADHIHAIWYCINQGGSRYQQTEADFVKELHSIGVPFIIVITQCVDEDDEFAKEVNKLNRENGITDIPVVEVLAQDRKFRGGGVIPAFGLDTLVDTTLEMLPSFIKGSFIAGQQIKVVLKREECERIIIKYEKMAETELLEKIPIANIFTTDQKFKNMQKEIFAVYNQIISKEGSEAIAFEISTYYTKNLINWCLVPERFSKNKERLEKLMGKLKKMNENGLELEERDFSYSLQAARFITFFGYTLICSVEDVWEMIRQEKIKNLEEVVIPQLKEKIKMYMTGKKPLRTDNDNV